MGRGLLKYDPISQKSILYNHKKNDLINDLVFDLVIDQNNVLWVATAGMGIHYLTKDHKFQTIHTALPDDTDMDGFRKTLLLDKDYLWIGTEGSGVYRMEIENKSFINFREGPENHSISSNLIKDLSHTKNGNIYVATDGGGLNIINPETKEATSYLKNNTGNYQLNSNALQSLFLDRNDNLWIGTFNGGINILKSNKTWFEIYKPESQNSKNTSHSILDVTETEDGTLWIGTDGSGMFELNKSVNEIVSREFAYDFNQPLGIGSNVVKTIFEDRSNLLWIGLFGAGLDKYDRDADQFTHFRNDPADPYSLSSNNIWSISEDKKGHLWIGTLGHGINIYNPKTNKFRNINNDESLNEIGLGIMALQIDEDEVYIGDQNDGLYLYNLKNDQISNFKNNSEDANSISNDEIRAIYKSKKGELWIGTEGGGLNKWLGNGKFKRILRKDGLIANSVMGITEDNDGSIWISTFDGISQLDPETEEIVNFSFHTRMNNQFNQMAIETNQKGELFFGGINGLNFLKPTNRKKTQKKEEIVFTSLAVNNEEILSNNDIIPKSIELSEKIYLDYNAKSFSLKFTDFNYSQSEEHFFQYRLDGFDEKWKKLPRSKNYISYTNINPGNYVLEIKNERTSKKLRIEILSPFWKTTWFKVLIALFFVSLLLSAIYFYNQRTKEYHRRELLKAERKILELKNENLASEINAKNSKLLLSSTQMAHKNEILSSIKADLQEYQVNPEMNIKKTIRKLDRELESEDYWKEFNLYFSQVDTKFIDSLVIKHENLTQNDIRLCGMLRLNLSTKEIATLLNVSVRGVEKSKYRLKKRLLLSADQDLLAYVRNFLN